MRPSPALEVILFDLDGVLIDSVPPIRTAMSRALEGMGRPPLTPEQVPPLIGPPLEDSAAMLVGNDRVLIEELIRRFRDVYRAVYLEETLPARGLNTVVPACADRYVLLVATSKPEAYAVPLLEHFGVAQHFRAIVGRSMELDHHTKAAVIARALTHVPGVPATRALMVGDRHFDVVGAREHGIDTVGIRSGAGGEAELRAAGAAAVVEGLPELYALLSETELEPPPA